MQALILAAGPGQRLAPLTHTVPKCLIPLGGRPLLSYQIRALQRWDVSPICVVAGAHKEKVEEFLKSEKNVTLVENPEYRTTNIIASLAYALKAIPASEDFILMAGDVIFEDSIVKGLKDFSGADVVLCVARKRCREEEVKVLLEGSKVLQLGKNLDPEKASGEFLGVFKASRTVMPEIRQIVNEMMASRQVQGYLFDMINRLITEKKRKVVAFDIQDAFWEDIDFPDDIERVEERIRNDLRQRILD